MSDQLRPGSAILVTCFTIILRLQSEFFSWSDPDPVSFSMVVNCISGTATFLMSASYASSSMSKNSVIFFLLDENSI